MKNCIVFQLSCHKYFRIVRKITDRGRFCLIVDATKIPLYDIENYDINGKSS